MILVDTSVWITADKVRNSVEARELDALLGEDEVAITDVVIAEILHGATDEANFAFLAERLDAPRYFHASKATWLNAARLAFDLKRRGLMTALSDLVIASVAIENDLAVYASDPDFQRVPGLRLHQPTTTQG